MKQKFWGRAVTELTNKWFNDTIIPSSSLPLSIPYSLRLMPQIICVQFVLSQSKDGCHKSRWYIFITASKYRKIVCFFFFFVQLSFVCLFQWKKKLSQWPGLSDILIAYKEIAVAISGMFSFYSRRQSASEDKFEKRSGFRWKTISV